MPNADQITYWNEVAGPKWVALQRAIDAQIRPFGLAALERAAVRPGEHAVDVGCGCGDATLELARRVGPSGTVLAIDVSRPMLERATAAARDAGLAQIRFESADAQTYAFPRRRFDLVFSRFGVMFFEDPAAALANLATALRAGGRLAFVCWRELERNPWLYEPMRAAAAHVTFPPREPGTPGPFALADADRLRATLDRAGFADVSLEEFRDTMVIGGSEDPEAAVEFVLQIGPTAAALRETDAATRARVAAAVRAALAPYRTARGVRMEGAAWLVSARCGR